MVRYALGALTGTLYFLGWAGFDLWPLAFIAFVPMIYALDPENDPDGQPLRWKTVFGIGFFAGLAMNIGGFYWLSTTLRNFSGFSLPICIALMVVVCSYQALGLSILALLYRYTRVRLGVGNLAAALIAMCFSEWVFPELFTKYFGAALHGLPLAIQVADLGGPLLLSGLLIAASVAFYELSKLVRKRAFKRKRVLIIAGVWAATLIYGGYRIHAVEAEAAASDHITVGTVQTNMGLTQKRDDPEEGLQRHIDQTLELQKTTKLDLLVWPESAFAWFLPDRIKNMRRIVFKDKIHIPTLFGGLSVRERNKEIEPYNTAYMVDSDGDVVGTYDKTYLLAFGEYIPFGDRFPQLYDLSPHTGRFISGKHVQPMPFGRYRLTALICYEDVLPSFVSRAVRAGDPHLLVNMTNDAWFGDTHEPWQHLALAKLRAVEHHRALVRSTNSGVTAIVDPVGRLMAVTGVFTRENISASVPMLENGQYPYAYIGDWPGYLSLLALLALSALKLRKKPA
jgi:apolipoprotein N-acyltransferase